MVTRSLKKSMFCHGIITFIFSLLLAIPSYAGVIFETNFDSVTWNANGALDGTECYSGTCANAPSGFSYYRTLPPEGTSPFASIRPLPAGTDHTTGTTGGHAFIANYPNVDYTGDAVISKLFPTQYPELYLRVWVKTQANLNAGASSSFKIFRALSYHGTGNFYQYFVGGQGSPLAFVDLGSSSGYPQRIIQAARCDPNNSTANYECAGQSMYVDKAFTIPNGINWRDGNWHRIDIHVKINSPVGANNGIYAATVDGIATPINYSDAAWLLSGSSQTGWNGFSIGGNSVGVGTTGWVAFDDLVISTTAIPDNYVVGGGTTAAPDTTAPTVAVSAPASNSTVSGTVSVTASASDNVGVTKVEFYVNGALQAADTATPYLYSWNTSALAAGAYTLMAKAYDAAGNVGQSSNVVVNIVKDTTAPTVSLTAPGNGTTLSGTVAITASASDNIGVTKVEFYANGSLLYAGNVAPYSYSWNTTSVADGSYPLTAKAYDAAGNIGQSPAVTITVKNGTTSTDTTAPSLTAFTMPATAASLSVPVSSLSATDNVGVTGYLISESSSKPAATATGWTASAPTSFTFAGSGARTAYAWAKDAAGNICASRSAAVTITLSSAKDTTAPVVAMTSPLNNSTVKGTVTIAATASDNVGVTKVEYYLGSTLLKTVTSAPYSFSIATTTADNGTYSLSAKAYDAAGNVGQSSAITVKVSN